MSSTTTTEYYVPAQSRWPILASIALFGMAFGAGNLLTNSEGAGLWILLAGALMMSYILFGWFKNVIDESHGGLYSAQMDKSFRWGMSWFIFSEIMFFAAFFGVLFYVRTWALPWLGGEGDKGVSNMLWPGFVAEWPLFNPPDAERFPGPESVISPWQIPLLNTCLLVTSSFTLTFAHKALINEDRPKVMRWMCITIALGSVFLFFQGYEYYEAYNHLGLTLQSGIYGATFFMLTGFHGLHVTLGTIMIIIITLRLAKGHFSPKNHFGFEATAWYWHFVDVVWIGLFIFVYVF